MPRGDADVIVLGGGPAGSSTATLLARKGWRVTLLERERFPRPHVGESLLSGSMPMLRELGVADSLEAAGFLKKYGATMVWGTQATPWSWYFGEVDKENPHAYQVSRPEFDQILLRNARENGVDVRERHRATAIELEASEGATVVFNDDQGRHRKLLADFIVDATGQTGMIARKQKLRIDDPFFQNLGVSAYFEGGKRLDAPNENNILVESVTDGWIWLIPLVLVSETARASIESPQATDAPSPAAPIAGPRHSPLRRPAVSCHERGKFRALVPPQRVPMGVSVGPHLAILTYPLGQSGE